MKYWEIKKEWHLCNEMRGKDWLKKISYTFYQNKRSIEGFTLKQITKMAAKHWWARNYEWYGISLSEKQLENALYLIRVEWRPQSEVTDMYSVSRSYFHYHLKNYDPSKSKLWSV